jgi:hypothetical protein
MEIDKRKEFLEGINGSWHFRHGLRCGKPHNYVDEFDADTRGKIEEAFIVAEAFATMFGKEDESRFYRAVGYMYGTGLAHHKADVAEARKVVSG